MFPIQRHSLCCRTIKRQVFLLRVSLDSRRYGNMVITSTYQSSKKEDLRFQVFCKLLSADIAVEVPLSQLLFLG